MKRALVLGAPDVRPAVAALGITRDTTDPDLLIVDADDEGAVEDATRYPSAVARIFIAGASRAALLRAAGVGNVVERPLAVSSLGLAILHVERARARGPRALLFTSATGATGRTSLIANVALRLARRVPVLAIDATSTGALAWRLNLAVAPWADIVGLGEELTEAHLRLAAAERDGALFIGGCGSVSPPQLHRVISTASKFATVLVDSPALALVDDTLLDAAERVYVCANPDVASAAVTAAACASLFDRGAHLVISQARERDAGRLTEVFGYPPAFILPRDEASLRRCLLRRGPANGRLGRAYEVISEIVLADVTA